MNLLETRGLVKRYSGRVVVDHVSLRVGPAEIVGLLGRNGAGKTTTFGMTIGMVKPDAGTVMFDGMDVTNMPMFKRARRGIGYLAQDPSIFQRLSVEDNLLAVLESMTMSRRQRMNRAEELMDEFGLTYLRRQLARTLSGGERAEGQITVGHQAQTSPAVGSCNSSSAIASSRRQCVDSQRMGQTGSSGSERSYFWPPLSSK